MILPTTHMPGGSANQILQNKELEASEERKRRAKQLEMQRKEMSRSSRGANVPRTPSYPAYTPSVPTTVPDTYDSYNAEKNKASKFVTILFRRFFSQMLNKILGHWLLVARACSWVRNRKRRVYSIR